MAEFSRLSLWGLVSFSLMVTTACRNETPAFTEQDMASIAVSIADTGYETEDRDNVFSMDQETSSPATNEEDHPEEYAGYQDEEAAAQPGRHSLDQDSEVASNGTSSNGGSASDISIKNDDAKDIAKACAQHFKGVASKIVVLSAGDSISSISLSPQTILAVRMTGNQPSLNLALAAGQPLAGLCLVLRGHEPSLRLSSGAAVKKMVYLAAGDQTTGEIQFSNGLEDSYIDMSGNAAQLTLRGVRSHVCDSARLRNHSAQIRCIP